MVVIPSAVFETWTAFGSWSVEAIEAEARLFWLASSTYDDESGVWQCSHTTIKNNDFNHTSIETLRVRLGPILN